MTAITITIDRIGYAIPYQADDRSEVKVGLLFDIESWSLKDWKIG